MVKYTITPWRFQGDLLKVREQLYSASEEDRRHAVNRVMAWKLRGNLPHAVESTALLTDAVLHHSVQGNSIFSVRAVYSAAFTRFVTGYCDIGRNKERSLEPSSMLAIAKQLGMPSEFVALRHEATHEEMPAIQRLVKVADDALQWLWNVYWSRLEEPESEDVVLISLPQMKEDARQLLKDFRSTRRAALRSMKQKQQLEGVQRSSELCTNLMGKSFAKCVAFAEVVVDEELLLPSKRQFGSPLDGAYLIWDPLLESLTAQRPEFLRALIRRLLIALGRGSSSLSQSDGGVEGTCLWLLHIFDYPGVRPQTVPLRREVMSWCCTHPGYWAQYVGRQLLASSDSDFREVWEDVLEASQLLDGEADSFVQTRMSEGHESPANDVTLKPTAEQQKPRSWQKLAVPSNTPIGVLR